MTHLPSTYPALAFNIRVDAVVLGGGLTGITAAYLIKQAGCTVALVERNACGAVEPARPSVVATAVPRSGMTPLVDRMGPDWARAVWEAGFAAVARVRANVRDERINCQFGWLPACRYASPAAEPAAARAALWREATLAASLGIEAIDVDRIPGLGQPGLRFDGQARFHPFSYLSVLVSRIPGAGSYVLEQTGIDVIEGQRPFVVRSGEYRITSDHLIVASSEMARDVRGLRLPALGLTVQDVQRPVVSATVERSDLADGVYWEHGAEPVEALHVDRTQPHLTISLEGEVHEHAGPDTTAALARRLCDRVPGARLTYRRVGRAQVSADGLPYIGAIAPRQFAALGLDENDVTFGTLAGMMAADAVSGKVSPWQDRFGFDRGTEHREVPLRAASSA